jgi:hypothetical protein
MFGPKTLKLLGVSIALLVVGYVLLGIGPEGNHLSRSVAPLVLVATYCVLIPLALLAKDKGQQGGESGRPPKGTGAKGA